MSIITIYPTIPDVDSGDLMIISDTSKDGNPTRTVSIGQLSSALSPATGISITTVGTTGASTIVGNVLNVPIYQGSITLTTTGTTGASTLTGDVLNIPNYTLGGPIATSSVYGTVKLEDDAVQSIAASAITETVARTYGIQVNSSGQMVVNVPWISGGGSGSVDAIISTSPLTMSPSGGTGTVTMGIQVANTSQSGYLNTTDWDTFNDKQDTIVLTTTGTTGAATLVGSTINIPQYDGIGSGVTSLIGTLPITVSSSTGAVTVGVNTATVSTLGVSKLGSTTVQTEAPVLASATASRTYPIQHNSSDQMVVNVPWSAEGSTATSSALGIVKLFTNAQAGATEATTTELNRTYGIQFNSSDQMVVNVPWVDTANSLTTNNTSGAATLVNGVINVPNYGAYNGNTTNAIFRLDISGTTVTVATLVNHFGGTWTVTRTSIGNYVLANTGVSMSQGLTMATVSNDNVTNTPNGAGGGDYPQHSVVGWQTSTTIKVLNFDLSTTGVGTAIDFINSIWVELRVFPS